MKNYLPFAVRETRAIAATNFPAGVPPSRSSVQIQSLDIGFGERAILQDLCVQVYQAAAYPSTQILMRVGWLGKGFILEKRIPAGLFINKSRPLVPTWKFVKPYILWPNQNLRARITNRGNRMSSAGLMFHGVRLKDDRPCMLYDTNETALALNATAGLADRSLRCPGDSPVALHSVSYSDWLYDKETTESDIQIWSPGGREWFQVSPFIGVAAIPNSIQRWIDPPTGLFALGEERGWVIDTGQTFIVEFENISTAAANVMVTLRGSVEVDEEERWNG